MQSPCSCARSGSATPVARTLGNGYPSSPISAITSISTSATAMGAQEMAKIGFTQNIQRHVTCRETEAAGHNVREVLDNLFAGNPRARSYVLDDQAALRKHMSIYIDGELIRDRVHLSDSVSDTSDIYVFQALSGG